MDTNDIVEKVIVKLSRPQEKGFKYEIPKIPPHLLKPQTKREIEYVKYIKKIHKDIGRDPMTGLHSKEHFEQMEKGKGVYIFIDGDGLKKLNDTYGHKAGHAAIKAISKGISEAIRSGDTVNTSRVGGDEFVVHVEGVGMTRGISVAKRILKNINEQKISDFFTGKDDVKEKLKEVPLEASVGVGQTEDEADKAMYKAKEKGRNRVEYIK